MQYMCQLLIIMTEDLFRKGEGVRGKLLPRKKEGYTYTQRGNKLNFFKNEFRELYFTQKLRATLFHANVRGANISVKCEIQFCAQNFCVKSYAHVQYNIVIKSLLLKFYRQPTAFNRFCVQKFWREK